MSIITAPLRRPGGRVASGLEATTGDRGDEQPR